MKIRFSAKSSSDRDAVVVTTIDSPHLLGAAKQIDDKTAGALTRATRAMGFIGQYGQTVHIPGPANENARHLFVKGLGNAMDLSDLHAEDTGRSLSKIFNRHSGVHKIDVELGRSDLFDTAELAAYMAFGAQLESYSYSKFKGNQPKAAPRELNFIVDDPKAAAAAFNALKPIADGEKLTKDLGHEPPNSLYPETFAARIQDEFRGSNVKVHVLDEKELEKLGMGSMLAVGQGSARPPRLVVMEYTGSHKDEKPLALVGKGITFDSGGISIKSNGGLGMKFDMSGAGAVVGAMKAISGRGAKANVVAVVALAENMPSGHSYRPDDVVKSMSGKTVEIINTDAEGRLVLNDALTYVQRTYDPDTVIDLATLTGAIVAALGDEYAGLFSNDNRLADQLNKSGMATDQKLWRMPVGGSFVHSLSSKIADLKHTGGRPGASVAATFLQQFIEDGVKWAHLDIAGTADKWGEATGYGVRLLDRFVADHREGGQAPKRAKKKIFGR